MSTNGFKRMASLQELRDKGRLVVKGGRFGIALFYDDGRVHALDNRCPHLGFPLHLGTVQDGILTCHWHHAQFDLCTGGTFDPWADDVPTYPVEVRGGEVYVDLHPDRSGRIERLKERLREGLEQNITLVIAKAVVGLLDLGVAAREIVEIGALFGVRRRAGGWASGLTILTAMANILPRLSREDQILALYKGLEHVAQDCDGQPPRIPLDPLPETAVPLETLKRWFRRFIEIRQVDGAERTLRTALRAGAGPLDVADMFFTAATDHFYRDGGHVLDFINKAFELLDHIGWDKAEEVLPSLLRQLAFSGRSEESSAWRQPYDLATPLRQTFEELPALLREGDGRRWSDQGELSRALLQDDPHAVIGALKEAFRSGARPAAVARILAHAAATRIARFSLQNEHADWIAVLHTFTYCNALHQALQRVESPALVRGIFHGAMAVYLDRFLNVPPARLPWEKARRAQNAPANGAAEVAPRLLEQFLSTLDGRQQVAEAAELVYAYLQSGQHPEALLRAFGTALLREDANFHTFQLLEAAIRQFDEWQAARPAATVSSDGHPEEPGPMGEEARLILLAAARYLAAHAPTMRESAFTARIALRLHRGEALHEEQDEDGTQAERPPAAEQAAGTQQGARAE